MDTEQLSAKALILCGIQNLDSGTERESDGPWEKFMDEIKPFVIKVSDDMEAAQPVVDSEQVAVDLCRAAIAYVSR